MEAVCIAAAAAGRWASAGLHIITPARPDAAKAAAASPIIFIISLVVLSIARPAYGAGGAQRPARYRSLPLAIA